MTKLERYKEKLAQLEAKRNNMMRNGKFAQSIELNANIEEVRKLIKEAEDYEESLKPRPICEICSRKEIEEMGIIPLMVECHLVADFLVEAAWRVRERCEEYGLHDVRWTDDLNEIIKKTEKFASFLTQISPELCDLVVNNETFNASLHKKYLKYIEQRLK